MTNSYAEWTLWRQDDNGAAAIIDRFKRREDAAERLALLEARGHKQFYWIECEPAAPTPSLNLVVIRSSDLEASRVFYEAIGLQFAEHRHGSGPLHLASETEGFTFEIYPANSNSSLGVRLGFHVNSVDQTLSDLHLPEERITVLPHDSEWGRRAVVVDPDGHRVELTSNP